MQNKGIPEAESFGGPVGNSGLKKYKTQLKRKIGQPHLSLGPQQRLSGFLEHQASRNLSFPLRFNLHVLLLKEGKKKKIFLIAYSMR